MFNILVFYYLCPTMNIIKSFLFIITLSFSFTASAVSTSNRFVPEPEMQDGLLQMLADFSLYMKNDFIDCDTPNAEGDECGCFKGEHTMANDERGVRPNADMSMICAFLAKYAKGKVELPVGVAWDDIESMARKSLIYAYSTHKANRLKPCIENNYWGAVSIKDHTWESSLWAMSVAYSAFFQWDSLTERQKRHIETMLKAECNYELERTIPTGFAGDTKAEENGWEADVLAVTLGLFPDDALAPRWFDRLRKFAVNSYSHPDDARDLTIIDPSRDSVRVTDLYRGQNLYDDYTLQNHNLFHTSYQNVVIQELGEAALALKIFQLGIHGKERWATNALMHNNQRVMTEVLNWLALADGELAMPNGNDWSLFLFDQITSYSTMACFLRDPDALMLENLAYRAIKTRQRTTADGSWLLNPDVGARRMGVQGHRVMMTWLMHHHLSTAKLSPTEWHDFNLRHSDARLMKSQNIVRASTPDRFSCFSWSDGLKSYTGYITPNNADNAKIIVPYRANNTGNILGWYEVEGTKVNAKPVVSGIYHLEGNAYTMNGEINTNDSTLNNRFAIYSTPGNAFIYLDCVTANRDGTITAEKGGLMAISTDPFTRENRTLYYGDGQHIKSDGNDKITLTTDYVNIDNALGIVSISDKRMAFGDRSLNNSIWTAKLYPSHSTEKRPFKPGETIDRRNVTYYSNIDASTTRNLSRDMRPLAPSLPDGWNGVVAPDPDGSFHLFLANFRGDSVCHLSGIECPLGAPIFAAPTDISDNKSSATFTVAQNNSIGHNLKTFVKGDNITVTQVPDNPAVMSIKNNGKATAKVTVTTITPKGNIQKRVTILPQSQITLNN